MISVQLSDLVLENIQQIEICLTTRHDEDLWPKPVLLCELNFG